MLIKRHIQLLCLIVVFALNNHAATAACGGTTTFTVPASGCINSKVTFSFSDTVSVNSYRLIFGDGNESIVSVSGSIDHTYGASGKFYVKLVRTIGACKDSVLDSIQISAKPNTAFTMYQDTVCSGQVDTFKATTSGLTSYNWKYGNGATSSGQNVTQSFTNAGASPANMTVKLVVTNSNGCSDSLTKTIIIMPLPSVAFTFSPDSSCSESNITFTKGGSGASTYLWKFGDGKTSIANNPSHTYSATGNSFSSFTTYLIASTSFGCSDSISKNIKIKERPEGSIKSNWTNYVNCNVLINTIKISDSSTTSSTDTFKVISWGDGNIDTFYSGFTLKPHKYTSKGYFTLSVYTVGKNGCSYTKTYQVFNGSNPAIGISSLGSTTNLCAPYNLRFVITSYSSNPPGTIYTISSNDGSSNQVYTHPPPDTITWNFSKSSCGYSDLFSNSNSFHVKITASNPCNTTPGAVGNITFSKPPIANFSFTPSDTVCKNTNVTFTDNSTDGSLLSSSSGSTCVSTHYRFWNINPQSNWDTLSSTTLGDPASWDDPSGVEGSSPLYVKFKDTGVYKIKLHVANEFSTCGSDSMEKSIVVINPPIAAFHASPDSGCITLTDTMINQSTGTGLSYSWSILSPASGYAFTGGTSSTSTNAIYKFTAAGTYIVQLAVTNACTTIYAYDTVKVKSIPSVTLPAISNGCKPYSISPSATYNSNNSTITSYNWSFTGGSPSSSTTQNPGTINYNTGGNYTVIAKATNECGTDSATRSFTVYNPPTVNAGKSVDTICLNNGNLTLSGYSPSGGTWSGTAVTSGGVFNPSTSGVGLFTLKYIYTDTTGCIDSATKNIKVVDKPTVKFVYNDRCIDTSIQFIDSSTTSGSTIASRKWYFGDGGTSTTTNPSHTYAAAGTYTVKLVITNSVGCIDSISYNVNVWPKPAPNFTINDTDQCLNGNSFTFTNTTTISSGSSTYNWFYGDGGTSTTTSPTYTYAAKNTYTVKLRATSNHGCRDSISKIVYVYPKPTVSFTINDTDQCKTGNSFSYTNTSSVSTGSIITYKWNFGNGATDTVKNPSAVNYTSSGVYNVTLLIITDKGCTDSITKQVIVYAMPVPSFTFGASSFCAPYTSAVSNTTAASPFITAWKWSIQGNTSVTISNDTAKQPTFTFPDNHSGTDTTYSIKLIATTTNGCIESVTNTVTIKTRPKSNFTLANDSCGPIVFNTTNSSQYATNYLWSSTPTASFSNTTTTNPTITLARNTTSSNITYTIKLISSTSFGCLDSFQKNIIVYFEPIAMFSMTSTDGCGPLKIYFTNTSTPSGNTFNWDFGNGKTSTIKDTNITYLSNGVNDTTFNIKLIATTSKGCFDDTIRQVTVRPDAKALYTYTNNSGCAPFLIDSINIKGTHYANANSNYKWFVGDTLLGSLQNGASLKFPGYTLGNSNDSILISLVAYSKNSCKNDTQKIWFKTISNPKPGFTMSDSAGCMPLKVLFRNVSTPAGLSHLWTFGNSTSSTVDSIYYTFTNSSANDTSWNIKLVASGGSGCKDSISKTIIVHPQPKPAFSISASACAPASISPSNTTAASPTITQWSWKIYCGATLTRTSSAQNPTFNFPDNQTGSDSSFTFILKTTTAYGCSDTVSKTIIIKSRPKANFSATTVCSGATTNFYDSSKYIGASPSWSWDFGDGNTSTSQSPTHTYAASGTYNAKLTVTGTNSCIDTITIAVVVNPQPAPTFTLGGTGFCSPKSITTSNTTSATPTISTWSWKVIYDSTITRKSSIKDSTFRFYDNQTGADSSFTFRLIATTNKGCKDSTDKSITLYTRPKSVFNAGNDGCGPLIDTIINTSSYASTYLWSVAPTAGSISSNTATNPIVNYNINNTSSVIKYLVKLIATTTNSCNDTAYDTVSVYPTPVAGYSQTNTDSCGPINVYFTNTTTPSGINNYIWNFGNGISSAAQDTNIKYTNTGVADSIYTILLTAKNSTYNCQDTQQTYITVRPNAKAFFTATDTISCAPFIITSSNILATAYANADSGYVWFRGGIQIGNSLTFPGDTIKNANDSMLISLVATSKRGCKNDTQKVWFKTISNPKPNFSRSDSVGCHPLSVNLTDASTPSSGLGYYWDLGNGQTSTSQNPTGIIYSNTGSVDSTYTVKLITSAGSGCKDSISKTIIVHPQPKPAFSISASACAPASISPSNTTAASPTITQWSWKIYCGATLTRTSSAQNPTFNFPDNQTGSDSSFTFILKTTTAYGCSDTVSKTIIIKSRPKANFSATTVCSGATTNFYDSSKYIGASPSWSWDFGDGNTSTSQSPTHTYAASGTYNAKLTVTGTNSCIDTITIAVVVNPQPAPTFTLGGTGFCSPKSITTSNTTSATPTISTWSWKVIYDSTITRKSSIKDSTFRFYDNQTGADSSFTFRLIATTNKGCKDSTDKSITLYTRPKSVFNAGNDGCGPLIDTIINTSSYASTYLWSVAPTAGSISSNTATNPIVNYNINNTSSVIKYLVKLIATTTNSCNDTAYDTVSVYPTPVAGYSQTNTDSCGPINVYFTNTTTPSGINNYIWNFGNGISSAAQDTNIKYTNTGVADSIYTILLTAKNSTYNCQDTQQTYITVRPNAKATFTASYTSSCAPFIIDNSIITPSDYAYANSQYQWYKNGSAFGASQTGTTLSFPGDTIKNANDSMLISLVATSKYGCKDDTIKMWFKTFPNPAPAFVISDTINCHPLTTNFTNNSLPSSGLTYTWDFGNGLTSNTTNPTNIKFTNIGIVDSIYKIKLIVSAGSGCKDSLVKNVTVKPLPNPNFNTSKDTLCPNNILTLNNISSQTPPINSYKWTEPSNIGATINNDTASIATTSTYADNQSGNYINYTYRLIAKSNFGCLDSTDKTVKVATRPVASIVVNPDSSCGPKIFNITNNSLYGNTWMWTTSFLNINFSNTALKNPTLSIPENKGLIDSIYTYRLVATSLNGCVDTTYDTVLVHPRPRAVYIVDTNNSCAPVLVSFINNSSGNTSLSYFWDLGDGNTSAIKNPKETYNSSSTQDTIYYTNLIVSTNYGCADTASLNIKIKPNPTAVFNVSDTLICAGSTFSGIITSYNISYGNVDSFYWDFGDGYLLKTIKDTSIIHKYNTEGHYKIKLMAANECDSSYDSINITILEKPKPKFSISDSITCNAIKYFTNTTLNSLILNYISFEWDFGNGVKSNKYQPDSVDYGYIYGTKDTIFHIQLKAWNICDTVYYNDSIRLRPALDAAFTPAKQFGCSPLTIKFNNQSLGVDSNKSASTNYYVYIWDDGKPNDTVISRAPMFHTFNSGIVDTFNVKIFAFNDCKVDSDSVQIIIYPNTVLPQISILPANGMGCNPLTITFKNNTTGASSYTWYFDSINSSNSKNVKWTFTKAGIYNVEMKASNGCSDTSTFVQITVTDPPIASFTDSGNYCEPALIFFKNNTTSGNSYTWYFGDGDSSTLKNPQHKYDTAGMYQVKLIAQNSNSFGVNCVDTFSKYITIFKKPVPVLSASTANGCEPLVVNFSGLGSTYTKNYFWDFGNGSTSTNTNPQQTYNTLGADTTYKVRLITTNVNGCSDSAFTTITVYAKPIAIINAVDTFACFPGNLSFTNASSSNSASANWDFGDGQTSTTFNSVNHTWAKPGIYNLRLKVTTVNGCVDSTVRKIKIGGNDTLKIVAFDTILCLGVKGTYQSPNVNPQKVQWDFGDGNTDTGRTVKHNWFNSGIYTMIMTMTGPDGCIDSATRQITVNKLPVVDFSVNDSFQCVNAQQFNFTANASAAAGLSTFTWKWGDGNKTNVAATVTNANHSYTTSGIYTVRLIATTTQGCIDSAAHSIVVWPKPNMSYNINDTDQCVNSQFFSFTNTSSVSSGFNDYNWNFGDGQFSNTTSPTHTYADTGVYKVTLYATTDNGCTDSITKTIYVRPKPTLDFSRSDTTLCLNGNTFTYTPTASIPYGTITLLWDYGDGNTKNMGNSVNAVTHSYAAAGTYNIKLRVNSSFGCVDSVTKTIVVWPKPSPTFTINDSLQCVNLQNFIYTNNSSILTGSMQYDWEFGDGNTSVNNSAKNVSHNYANYGMYDIKLVAISNFGCKDSVTSSIIVAPKPTVDYNITSPDQCLNLNNYSFIDLTTIPGGNLFYTWYFGDGKTSTNQSPSHIYNSAGTYTVKMVVISQLGCTDSITKQMTVWPKPTVAFNIKDTEQCLTSNSFLYTNNCSILSGTITYDWYWGDGNSTINSGNGQQTHSYNTAGVYTITLIATSDKGCVDTLKRSVVVRAMPVALFGVNQDSQCVNNQAFDYINQSTIDFGGLQSFWDFGNGKTSSLKNPSTFYNTAGNYTVNLWVTSDYGCSDSINHIFTVTPKPKSDFSLSDTAACVQLMVKFTDQSSSDAVKWLWDFDDPLSGGVNNSSASATPTHIYIQPGSYYPNLISFNKYGCSDTSKHHAIVYADPVANFYINPTAACDTPMTANCINISQNAVAYVWDLGNSKTSALANPTAIYINNGTYNVILTAITTAGCIDSMTLPYIVAKQPKAIFTLKPHEGCEPLVVQFENKSINNTFNFWNFDDGQGSIIDSPIHIYNKAGTYIPTLMVKNGNCYDTANMDTIIVHPLPVAGFSWAEVGPPPSGSINFTNQSLGAFAYFWDFGDGTQSFDVNPAHRYQSPKDYIVTLIVNTNFGCYDTFVQTVHVDLMKGLWVSNAMSPDDHKGDASVFQPQGVGLETYHVQVFTTWGELIWESTLLEATKPKEHWDGTWQGKPCKQDVYVWKINATFIDGSVWPGKVYPDGSINRIGSLTLIR